MSRRIPDRTHDTRAARSFQKPAALCQKLRSRGRLTSSAGPSGANAEIPLVIMGIGAS